MFFLWGQLYATLHHMVHQWTDLFRVLYAFGVKVNDLVKGAETPVVHVWCGECDVAERRSLELAVVCGIKPVVVGQVGGKQGVGASAMAVETISPVFRGE